MRINKLLLALTMLTISLNAHAWWAGSWDDGHYSSGYSSDTPESENNNNIPERMNYTQQQYELYKQYQEEIQKIHKEYQDQARAADKAYQERMKQWYKQ